MYVTPCIVSSLFVILGTVISDGVLRDYVSMIGWIQNS